MLAFQLDENGFIHSHHLHLEQTFSFGQVQNDFVAGLGRIVKVYNYDGDVFTKIHETSSVNNRQIPFSSLDNCFYWVTINETEPRSSVERLCQESDSFTQDVVLQQNGLLWNILALPDNRIITIGADSENSLISLYQEKDNSYQLLSVQKENIVLGGEDLEFIDNHLFVRAYANNIPDGLSGSEDNIGGGVLRYNITGNLIHERTKISDLDADSAGFDHIAVSPKGIFVAHGKTLQHLILSNGKITKRIITLLENSISSVYVHGDYLITVLRDSPSSSETGPVGVHIFKLSELM